MDRLIISNMALKKIGARSITSSNWYQSSGVWTTDGNSVEANALNECYEQVLQEVLEEHPFSFAQKRSELVNIATPSDTADDWVTATDYVAGDYVVFSDITYICLVAHTSGTFNDDYESEYWAATTTLEMTEDGMVAIYLIPSDFVSLNYINDANITYKLEVVTDDADVTKKVILADSTGLKIQYTYLCDTPTLYSSQFIKALVQRLAAELCFYLTENRTNRDEILTEYYEKILPKAITKDSKQSSPIQPIQTEWDSARITGGAGMIVPPGSQTWHPVE